MDITLFLTHCLLNAHLGHLYWMQYVLIVGILIATASCTILAYALGTNVSNVPGTHGVHPTTIQIERAVHVEDTPSIDRAGDAKLNSRLMIDNDYMDSTKVVNSVIKLSIRLVGWERLELLIETTNWISKAINE